MVPHPEPNHIEGPRNWWAKPQLRADEDAGVHRKVSYLDLFFDLVFVVAIAQLAHSLSAHPDLKGFGTFAFLFLPVWWLWIGSTFYTERFETGEISHRLFTVAQMVPLVGMAAFAHGALGKESVGFALSYILGRIIIIALWARGGYHDAKARTVTNRYVLGFSIGAALWGVSLFVPAPWRFWLWGAGILVDFATPWTMMAEQAKLPKLSTSRLPERFALFTIIVLGESIVGTVGGLAAQLHIGAYELMTGFLGLTIAVALWWMYFDTVGWRPTEKGRLRGIMRSYLHLPLAMAITAAGSGVYNVVGHEGEVLPAGVRWLITGALAGFLVTLWAFQYVLLFEPSEEKEATRYQHLMLVAALALVALGALGGSLSPLALLASAVGVFLAIIGYGSWRWAVGNLA